MREVLKIYDNSRMSVGATPSLKFIADTVGDTAPHAMSEMYGIRFATGNSPTTGVISLSDFRNQVLTKDLDDGTTILASDAAAGDRFGYSVAISGDYAIMGAPYKSEGGVISGSAYIFHRTRANTWDDGTKILASDAAANDFFGQSVGISGDYAIVGAWRSGDIASAPIRGSAYIFHRTGTNTWDDGTKILAPDAEDFDQFGWSVAISGDCAIVGARNNDDGGANRGSAYIFYRTGTNTWDAGTKILAPDPADFDQFGTSVAISGNYAIVGAPFKSDGDKAKSGSAYIFRRIATNTWDAGTKILAPGAAADDQFGYSVAISENSPSSSSFAIVGAPYNDDEGANSGSAYIFRRIATNTWDAGTRVLDSGAAADDRFGYSVGISGHDAIMGTFSGSAYIFRRKTVTLWGDGIKISAGFGFGQSVGISGDCAIAGAPFKSDGDKTNSGSAYTFLRGFYI